MTRKMASIGDFVAFVVAFLILWTVVLAWDWVEAQPGRVDPSLMEAHDYESITVGAAAIGFTSTKITKTNQPSTRAALCTLEGTATLRYRIDGTDPTGSEGHLTVTPSATAPVSVVILGINNVLRFRAIRTGSDATLKCTYLR